MRKLCSYPWPDIEIVSILKLSLPLDLLFINYLNETFRVQHVLCFPQRVIFELWNLSFWFLKIGKQKEVSDDCLSAVSERMKGTKKVGRGE